MDDRIDPIPLPSEDEGDLADEPPAGMTDDPIVAGEEALPWDPPLERAPIGEPDPAEELAADDSIQAVHSLPRDDFLRTDVIEALRASDVVAGDRLRVAVTGSRVMLAGQVESVDVLDEILGIVGDVRGVDEVVDEVEVAGL